MNIEEMKNVKRNLENELSRLINQFQNQSGLTIDSIELNQMEITSMGDNSRKFIAEVKTEVKL